MAEYVKSFILDNVGPYLTKFLVGYTTKDIQIGGGLFAGGITLTFKNMRIRPDILDQFGFPFKVFGSIGNKQTILS